ncbi:MAG: caspase family protein [Methyloligellaceae bacterium]
MAQEHAGQSRALAQRRAFAHDIFLGLLALSFLIFFSGLAQAAVDQKRVALVIGNSSYKHTTTLKNPKNDARDVAAALRRLGFDVIEGTDLAHAEMRAKVRDFSIKVEGADVALFYYAGHGVQVDNNNYLAPVNARLSKESDLDFETVSLNFILRQMEREKRTNLVFLDACRDNPLSQKLARSMATRSTSVGRGLARVESAVGMLIGYATSPGDVALDGDGRNSPYTTAVLKHIETPGIGINDMMIRVRQDVINSSKGKQVPWEHSSLTGQFVFKVAALEKKVASQPAKKKPATVTDSQTTTNELTRQTLLRTDYQATVAIGTCGAYKLFEEQHRGTFYGRLAEEYIRTNCDKQRQIQVEAAKKTQGPAETKTEPKVEKTIIASNDPTAKIEAPSEKETLTGTALVLALQNELLRLGCAPGRADGQWGRKTKSALIRFNKYAKLNLPGDGPSATTLATLKGKAERICPIECGAGQELKGDKCVVRAKPKNTTKTVSKKPRRPVAKKRPVVKRAPPPRRTGPKEDEFKGGEDTASECRRGLWTGDCFPQR